MYLVKHRQKPNINKTAAKINKSSYKNPIMLQILKSKAYMKKKYLIK